MPPGSRFKGYETYVAMFGPLAGQLRLTRVLHATRLDPSTAAQIFPPCVLFPAGHCTGRAGVRVADRGGVEADDRNTAASPRPATIAGTIVADRGALTARAVGYSGASPDGRDRTAR